jgi:chorismate mutase
VACRGIIGAITVPRNTRDAIVDATKELLQKMVQANDVSIEDIAAMWFTATRDLNATFPAVAARELGWSPHLALMCSREMRVSHTLTHCIRILMLVNTERKLDEIVHVYLGGAENLSPERDEFHMNENNP